LTPETEEPASSSGEAAKTIYLIDEADENTAPILESYRPLETVYGGTIHDDDGTQLHGGISLQIIIEGVVHAFIQRRLQSAFGLKSRTCMSRRHFSLQ
jgi:hypothetical protein